MKKLRFAKQRDSMECGIACLQMISEYYGKKLTQAYLSKICFATTEGVSLLGIRDAAIQIGFNTLPYLIHHQPVYEFQAILKTY